MGKLLAAVLTLAMWISIGFAALIPGTAHAEKKKPPQPAATINKEVNACGCYRDSQGQCFCGKKGKCVCPGECEPKGCDEKRAKEIEREVANETRKAAEADKKQQRRSGSADKKAPKSKSETPPPAEPKGEDKPKP